MPAATSGAQQQGSLLCSVLFPKLLMAHTCLYTPELASAFLFNCANRFSSTSLKPTLFFVEWRLLVMRDLTNNSAVS